MNLPKSLLKYADRLSDYKDERSFDVAIFMQYAPGWKEGNSTIIRHAASACSVSEALSRLKATVPCDCKECKNKTH